MKYTPDSHIIQKAMEIKKTTTKVLGNSKKIFLKAKKIDINKHHPKETVIKKKKSSRLLSVRNIKRIIFFGTLTAISIWIFWGIPLPTNLTTRAIDVSTKIFDRNGTLIYEIYADKRSTPVKLDDLPHYVKEATISIEDKDFYKHYGVSFTGMVRAGYNIIVKQKLQGGSTLTQQLVKTALLTPERTVKRKIRELALTLFAETIYSKNRILELYLNQIPYGGTAYGIGAASEVYFGKPAKELTLAEAALLAGLPAAPSRFSPFGSRPDLAQGRQVAVLRRMVEDKYITQEQMDEALKQELKFAAPSKFKAPHFALWVKELLAEKYGDAVVEKGGLRVTTTLDLTLQDFAEVSVATEVAKLKAQKVGNGAALVTRPQTGEILAMVGSKDYFAEDEDGKVNITLSHRQPGSSIKPINYALAIEDKKITASTVLADVPTCFVVSGQKPYCPKNYDGGFHGAVQTRYALANSYNIPAVRVLALNGIEHFMEFATKMGITTFTDPSHHGLSLTLGGGEVMPYDMAVAFGVFANGGIVKPITPFIKIEDWNGKVLEEIVKKPEGTRVLSQETSFIISNILTDNGARSAAFGPSSFLNVKGHPEVSVKTGTTNDRKDNWTIGYTRHALVVTWVGNNDNTPMSGAVSGVSGASPIWNEIMKKTLDLAEKGAYGKDDEGHGWAIQPKGILNEGVCIATGVLPREGEGCQTRQEFFLASTVPTSFKGGVQEVEFRKDTGGFIDPDTPQELREKRSQSVMYDPLGTFVCLDCGIPPASQSATIKYPLKLDSQQQ